MYTRAHMDIFLDQLQLVILDNPGAQLYNDAALMLFQRILALRSETGGGPSDRSADRIDFIATHISVCFMDELGYFQPVSSGRVVSLSRCLRHGVDFPPLIALEEVGAAAELGFLRKQIAAANASGRDLAYAGAWVLADIGGSPPDRDATDWLRTLHLAAALEWYVSQDMAGWSAFAMVRSGMPDLLEAMGAKAFGEDVAVARPYDALVRPMFAGKISSFARSTLERHGPLLAEKANFVVH
jgi:hypothetical protein